MRDEQLGLRAKGDAVGDGCARQSPTPTCSSAMSSTAALRISSSAHNQIFAVSWSWEVLGGAGSMLERSAGMG